jgi:hypothetical protein
MVSDQQLLGLVLEAPEQDQGYAAAVLAALAPQVLQDLEHSHPSRTLVHERVTALLAGGTAEGAAFLAAALMEGGALFEAPGMVEAACSGLLAACNGTAAVDASTSSSSMNDSDREEFACLVDPPPAHTVLLQYLRGLVDVVLHLATHQGGEISTRLAEPGGPVVPAVAKALMLLVHTLRLPGWGTQPSMDAKGDYGQRPYHDAAWSALLVLSECPGTAALMAALLQHQPGLCEDLVYTWVGFALQEEPRDNAARLAACLLLSGSIPGQEQRQQLTGLVEAGIHLWGTPGFWHGRAGMLFELLRLPRGPAAVMRWPVVLHAIFTRRLLGQHQQEGLGLLLAAPAFASGLVSGLQRKQEACLAVVGAVWDSGDPEQVQALLAVPGFGEALAQCCSVDEHCPALDWILGDALSDEVLQAYLAQQPVLLQALVARLRLLEEHSDYFWDCLADDDSGDGWLMQQPGLLDGVVAALVVERWYSAHAAAARLLEVGPTLLESLMRQPGVLEELLRVLVQRHWHPPADSHPSGHAQQLLLEGLADSDLAHRALALLPGLLAKGDAELSIGVFEAMRLIQARMVPGSMDWCQELAATSSSGAGVLCAEGQLQALRQGVEEVDRATAAAAATTRQLQEQQQQQRRPAQQAVDLEVHGAVPQEVGSGSRKRKGHPGQSAVAAAGSLLGAKGRLVPGKPGGGGGGGAAAAAASYSSGGQEAGKPAARSRTRSRR